MKNSKHHKLSCIRGNQIHDGVSLVVKFSTMQRLRHVISEDFVCWAILNADMPLLLQIVYEEVTNIQVTGSLAGARPPIRFQLDCALVIL